MSVCLCVCSLFLTHSHSFAQICMKFSNWRHYTLQTVVRVSERRSCAQSIYAAENDWRAPSGNSELAGGLATISP